MQIKINNIIIGGTLELSNKLDYYSDNRYLAMIGAGRVNRGTMTTHSTTLDIDYEESSAGGGAAFSPIVAAQDRIENYELLRPSTLVLDKVVINQEDELVQFHSDVKELFLNNLNRLCIDSAV